MNLCQGKLLNSSLSYNLDVMCTNKISAVWLFFISIPLLVYFLGIHSSAIAVWCGSCVNQLKT